MRFNQNFLTVIFLLSVTFLSAQAQKQIKLPMNSTTKLYTYEKIIEVTGVSQGDLYHRGLEWGTSYYKNPTDVIRERDSLGGKLICKARFKISNPIDKKGIQTDAGLVQYTLTLLFKEGRYRYILSDINWKQASFYPIERWADTSSPSYRPDYNYYLEQTDSIATDIIHNMEKAIKTAKVQKSDNW